MKSIETNPESKIRVLCVVTWALGGDSGSWRALLVASALQEMGYEVMVHQYLSASTIGPQSAIAARFDAVPRRIFETSRQSTPMHHARVMAREKYDVVIGNNMNGAAYSLLGRFRAPLVLDLHGDMVAELLMDGGYRAKPLPLRAMRRTVYQITEFVTRKLCDRMTCVSREMMRRLADRGVAEKKLVYAPNCVDLEFFSAREAGQNQSLRRRIGIPADRLLLGYLGKVHPWQGVENFIEAARASEDPDLAFMIVGVEQTGIDSSLYFVGEVPVEEMPAYYSICDVCVLPRPSHPATDVAAPTKFVEYASMGKPIIATNVGDAAELIQKYRCGIVVRDNSPAELSKGFAEIKALGPEARAEMGRAARRMAEVEFGFEITRKNFSRCIDELVQRN